MSYKDFVANFQRLEICFLGPDGLALDSTLGLGNEKSVKWESNIQEGSWTRSVNAGGCKNYPRKLLLCISVISIFIIMSNILS